MLKYDEVINLIISLNEITLSIRNALSENSKFDLVLIDSLYVDRLKLLEKLKIFFECGSLSFFDEKQRETVNKMIIDILDNDTKNLEIIESKTNESRDAIKNIQKQKSVLIYSKSSI